MSLTISPLLIVAVLALVASLLPRRSARRLAALGLLPLALAAAATVIAPGDGPISTLTARATMAGMPRETLLVDAALAAIGLVLMLAALIGAGRHRIAPPEVARASPVSRGILLGTVAMLLVPTLWLVVLASVGLALATAPTGRRRLLLAVAVAATTGAVAWFACTVGGTWDVRLTRLGEVPLSEAAQRAGVVPLLLAAGCWLAGAFAAAPARRATSWIGVLLLARVGTALVPMGLEALAPVLWPLAAAVIAWAAWRRRTVAAALAALTLAAATTASVPVALGLTAVALLLSFTDAYGWGSRTRRAVWAVASVTAVLTLPGVLRGQVVWTLGVLLMLGLAAWRGKPDVAADA